MGMLRRRAPVAAKMALPMAGRCRPCRFRRRRRGHVLAVNEDDFDLGRIAEAGKAIAREVRVEDAAVRKQDGFKQRAADALNDGARVLIVQAVGIDDRAGLPRADHADDLYFLRCGVDGDFGAGGDVAALLRAAGEAESAGGGGLPLAQPNLSAAAFRVQPAYGVR